MRWLTRFSVILTLVLAAAPAVAQPSAPNAVAAPVASPLQPPPLPREFRGLWVASVANIDWPSRRGLRVEELRREMMALLSAARRANFNAIVLQVRPACDALYRSDLEPWSEFLTGASGRAPATPDGEPPYDPLAEWVREAHALGLELHAWINPFRARHFDSREPDAPSHVANDRPNWVRRFGRYLWLDPGEPGARDHSLAVALDIVNRYDIDGLHFDDYFYPYPEPGATFPDDEPFARARAADPSLDRDAWRRNNIDTFVRDLYQRVKAAKPHVKVGVSPFGIWRPGFPPGVKGFDAFAGLHADARTWLRAGWLDYAAPQLYWPLASEGQPFARLLDWWIDQNDQRRHVWPGLNASRILAAGATDTAGKPAASWEPAEITAQIAATRRALAPVEGPSGGGPGVILFSAAALTQNRRGLAEALAGPGGPFESPALVPASGWLLDPGQSAPPRRDPPALAMVQTPSGFEVELPAIPVARWWGVWNKRGRGWGFHLFPAEQLNQVATTRRTGPRIILPLGSGDAALEGVAAFWLDAAGFASPTGSVSVSTPPR